MPHGPQPHPSAPGLGVHPDVAAEQPEVMAQGAAKAAGPATPQEDRRVQPTKYTLDDFQVGQQVSGSAWDGSSDAGTVIRLGNISGLIVVKLDKPTASGAQEVALYPTRSPRLTSQSPKSICKQRV